MKRNLFFIFVLFSIFEKSNCPKTTEPLLCQKSPLRENFSRLELKFNSSDSQQDPNSLNEDLEIIYTALEEAALEQAIL